MTDSAPSSIDAGGGEESRGERIRREARALMERSRQSAIEEDRAHPLLPSMRNNSPGAAQIVLDRFFMKAGFSQLAYYQETWYSYYKALWHERSEDDVSQFIHNRLLLCRQEDSDGIISDFNANSANLAEIKNQISLLVGIHSQFTPPCELTPGGWRNIDARGKMVCKGKVVNMITGEETSNQRLFIPNGAEWEYSAKAKTPKHWLKFLSQLFAARPDEMLLLQEWMGYVMSGDTWAQKGIIMVGPKRAGKGIIGHVLSLLLGESMVCSPALHALGGTFGLESLQDKRLCLVNDARLSNRQDTMAVIEMLLRIIARDSVDVQRKHKSSRQVKLDARVMMLSNSLPKFYDDSDAINSRFMIIKLTESFFGREDHGLLEKLSMELAGIALWCVEGYKRLMKRGAFLEPESSIATRKAWFQDSNPLSAFIEDRCEQAPEERTEVSAVFDAYRDWAEAQGMPVMPANALTNRLLNLLGDTVRRGKSGSTRYLYGLKLNGGGMI